MFPADNRVNRDSVKASRELIEVSRELVEVSRESVESQRRVSRKPVEVRRVSRMSIEAKTCLKWHNIFVSNCYMYLSKI